MRKINCRWNDLGAWCKNKRIKRSLFGVGSRCCIEYDGIEICEFKEPFPIPKPSPPPFIPSNTKTRNRENKLPFRCDKCRRLITQPGALLVSPPKNNNTVTKYYLCNECFENIIVYRKPVKRK